MNDQLPIQIISIFAAISCASITIGMSVAPAIQPLAQLFT